MTSRSEADRGWRFAVGRKKPEQAHALDVIPADAGTQKSFLLGSRVCGNDGLATCTAVACLIILFATSALADDQPLTAEPRVVKRFIGCPVYRDTDAGRKSGCWLVTDPADGVRYDVTPARLKPILGQEILVEGVITKKDGELCGGVTLEPLDVSVLPTQCKPHLIPAEGHPGRRFVLPAALMQPSSVPRRLPPPPYEPREYTIQFELDNDFLVYQYAEVIIENAVLYTKASKPRRVTITGYAATETVDVSGRRISEDIAIAEARARMIAVAFERLGVPRDLLELQWKPAPKGGFVAANGLTEAAKRRATIRIEPQ